MCYTARKTSTARAAWGILVKLLPTVLVRSISGAVLLVGCFMGGCHSWSSTRWIGDYDTAERLSMKQDRPILIYFEEDRPNHDSRLADSIKSERLRSTRDDFVRCFLVRSYERDRRYVAQYGVDRAPAVIVVHRDGTYHATSRRSMSADDLMAFLKSAASPGTPIHRNPYVPHKPRFDWYDSLDAGERAARQSGRPMLVLFHRTMSRDRRRLERLLSRHEVYLRLRDLVHVRIGLFVLFQKAYITKYGALQLPAIVIAHPDGTFEALELPQSRDAVVSFLDSALHRPILTESAKPAPAIATP